MADGAGRSPFSNSAIEAEVKSRVEIRFRNLLQVQIRRYSAVESNVGRVQPILTATKAPIRTRPSHPSRKDNPSRIGHRAVTRVSEGMSAGDWSVVQSCDKPTTLMTQDDRGSRSRLVTVTQIDFKKPTGRHNQDLEINEAANKWFSDL